MNFLSRTSVIVLYLALAAGVAAGAWWLVTNKPGTPKTDKPAPAATVTKTVKEEDLATITLTPEAESRIGVKVGTVEKKTTQRVRIYGGEVTIPIGHTVIVSSPLGGRIEAPKDGLPRIGQAIKKGQPVVELLPLLTPEGRATITSSLVDAEGQVNNAQTQVDAMKIAHDRAKKLLSQEAGSRRNADEAQAAYDLAVKTLEAATARKTILSKLVGDSESGTAAPIRIDAPQDGLLRNLSVLAGQNVPSGAVLFEIIDLSSVWVRVALPVDDRDEIARDTEVQIGTLAAQPGSKPRSAKPVIAPPSANPLSSTIDLFYELPNPENRLIPGQRLGVTIPLNQKEDALTIPWSAVVFDIHGGTWVYEETAPRTFARRRVIVRHVADGEAILASGPAAKSKIVVEGALELFASETGFSK